MKLDIELLNKLLISYAESGAPFDMPSVQEFAECREFMMIVMFLHEKGVEIGDMPASICTAMEAGFLVGLQYAELTRGGLPPDSPYSNYKSDT